MWPHDCSGGLVAGAYGLLATAQQRSLVKTISKAALTHLGGQDPGAESKEGTYTLMVPLRHER
jgi:hypothetical protein